MAKYKSEHIKHLLGLFAVFLFVASSAQAAFVRVNSDNSISSGTTCVSNSISITTGNLIVAAAWDGANVTWSAAADTALNTWHHATSAAVSSGGGSLDIWYVYNATGNASDVVTLTHGAGGSCSMIVLQYSGALTSSDPFEAAANSTTYSATSPVTTGAFIPGASGNLNVAIGGNGNANGTWTAGSGYTLAINEATQDAQTEENLSGGSGSQTAAIANNGASPLLTLGVASFKPTGGGGGSTPCFLTLLGVGCH